MRQIVSFEMLLMACQLEKFYELYLHILATTWANQMTTCRKLGMTDYDPQCIKLDYEMVIYTIRKRASGTLVWHASLERRPIQQPRGIIRLGSSSKESIAEILSAIELRTAEFGKLFLKIEHSEESSGGIY